MSLSKLFAGPDDPDYSEPMTRSDWVFVAWQVCPPFSLAVVFGAFIASDIHELYGEQAFAELDSILLVGLAGLVVVGIGTWKAATRKRG